MSQDRLGDLGDVDLDGIFADLEVAIRTNKPLQLAPQPAPLLPEPVVQGLELEPTPEEQEAAEVRYLISVFNGLQKRGPREDAQFFHDRFQHDKETMLSNSAPNKNKKITQNMTLQSLTETAEKQFKEAATKSRQLNASISQAEQLSLQTDFWAHISQVVKAAYEIKDQP